MYKITGSALIALVAALAAVGALKSSFPRPYLIAGLAVALLGVVLVVVGLFLDKDSATSSSAKSRIDIEDAGDGVVEGNVFGRSPGGWFRARRIGNVKIRNNKQK